MLLVNQQQDVRSMIIIGSHPSVPEFLLIYSRHALLMQSEPSRQSCLKIDLFSGDGAVEIQKVGVQEISSIAREAGKIFKRLSG
jgi:hypothetical protein